ncbi:MAG: hypothetical protein Q8P62_03740 [Candidatus Peregrinibacteria bacterium]|nr:hypothetical protein [Candidatus Peregrinibacteria bacterium]
MKFRISAIILLCVFLVGCSSKVAEESPAEQVDVTKEKSATVEEEKSVPTEKQEPKKITVTEDNSDGPNFIKRIYKDADGKIIMDAPLNNSMRNAISPDGRFLAYVEFPNIMLFDLESGKKTQLMSVLDNTDGVDFYWNPNSRAVAMTVVNQQDSTYASSFNTKLYLLSLDEKGGLIAKDRHLLKMRYECSDSGCNVDSEDFYFDGPDTIVYRTWESDTPYEDKGKDSLLRRFSVK